MSLPKKGLLPMGANNKHLQEMHPQSHQGVCADAIATLEGIPREALDELAAESQAPRRRGDQGRSLRPQPDPGAQPRRHDRPRPRGVPAAGHHGRVARRAAAELRRQSPTTATRTSPRSASSINQKYPDLVIEHVHHAGNSSGVVDGAAAVLYGERRLRQGARPQGPGPHRRHGQHGRRPDADAQRAGAGGPQGAGPRRT